MDDLDNVFERELRKDELTDNKEYIISFVKNFNLYALLKERERAVSVFSAESQSQTPPHESLELELADVEDKVQPPLDQPASLALGLSKKKLSGSKSTKHVMPPSLLKMEKEKEKEKEKEVVPKPSSSASKKAKPKALSAAKSATMPAPLSIFKESADVTAEVAAAAPLVAPVPKKTRARGIVVPKLNIASIEDYTPPQIPEASVAPLLKLPTFQAKIGSKKMQPISVSSSGVEAAAEAAAAQPRPKPEQPEEE